MCLVLFENMELHLRRQLSHRCGEMLHRFRDLAPTHHFVTSPILRMRGLLCYSKDVIHFSASVSPQLTQKLAADFFELDMPALRWRNLSDTIQGTWPSDWIVQNMVSTNGLIYVIASKLMH